MHGELVAWLKSTSLLDPLQLLRLLLLVLLLLLLVFLAALGCEGNQSVSMLGLYSKCP